MQEPKIYWFETKIQILSWALYNVNAVIFASFLTGVVLNTLFSASGYRIAIKIYKDCVLENNEAVEKFDNFTKTSRKVVKFWNGAFGWLFLSI